MEVVEGIMSLPTIPLCVERDYIMSVLLGFSRRWVENKRRGKAARNVRVLISS
jgi:hypothetical protein